MGERTDRRSDEGGDALEAKEEPGATADLVHPIERKRAN
jgi:hypothetical protein